MNLAIKILAIIIFLAMFLFAIANGDQGPDHGTYMMCSIEASKSAEIYKNTPYKDLDFYAMCIENVYYANPYNRGKKWRD